MRIAITGLVWLGATALWGQPVLAGDAALILANERYDNAPRVGGAAVVLDARAALEAAGFRVITGEALNADDARARVASLLSALDGADRVVVVLAGQTAHSGRDAWWLTKEAAAPNAVDAGMAGLSIGGLMDMVAGAGQAALVLVSTADDPITTGPGLAPGPGRPRVPAGVTLITGPAARLEALLANDILRPGRSLRRALADIGPDITQSGYIPDTVMVPLPPVSLGVQPGNDGAELGFWQAVALADTLKAYQSYLQSYPGGAHAPDAREQIAAIRNDPLRAARKSEEALSLNRDQRRTIQRNLSILGHDPRGIDGIFGPGTRGAISGWQKADGRAATGYLDAAQVAALQASAETRSAALEAEAAARQLEQDRRDSAYWHDTGAKGDEPGLRAYLKQYPDGLYRDVAQARLDQIEATKFSQTAADERLAWDQAREQDSAQAYRDYLRAYPQGSFAADAQARLDVLALAEGQSAAIKAAQAEEARVADNMFTRLLVEKRLQQIGLDPGPADGRFDDSTRSAIRRYQETRGLTVTGYLDQATVVRILAGQ